MGNIFDALQKSKHEKSHRKDDTGKVSEEKSVQTDTSKLLPAPRLLTAADSSSSATEQFRVARNLLRTQEKDREIKTILVTAVNAGTSTYLVSSNLAATFASEPNGNVLLVDANTRTAMVTRIFKADELPGVTNLLAQQSGETPLEERILNLCRATEIDGLTLLPSGGKADLHPETFIRSNLTEISVSLSEKFRCIIFEAPAVLEIMDVAVFASSLDATILVVEAGKTSRDDLLRAVELIQGSGANLVGCILSGAVQTVPNWLKRLLMIRQGR